MNSDQIKKLKIPDQPGVYFFKKGNHILYIGKATSLKDRIKSYFAKDLIATRGPILVELISRADKINWQETDSVLEAIILEAALIKKHQPKFNTKEKSDKSFNYVCITKETLPKVLIMRERSLEKENNIKFQAKYGPFTNGLQLKEAMRIIRPIFPYIDAQSAKKHNFEFYRQLGLTPDVSDQSLEEVYKKNIKNLKLFFEGKKKKIISNLKKEMLEYAKNKEFEHAGSVKKRIFALTHINDVALLKNNHFDQKIGKTGNRIEAYDIAHMSGKNMVGVMTVVENGEVSKSNYRKFKIRTQNHANDTGALKEVIERRLAHIEWPYPSLIVLDGGLAQINTIKNVLHRLNLDILPIVSVLKDERHNPKNILGNKEMAIKYEKEILLANSEAHRFAITYHKKMRSKNFLNEK